MNINKDYKMENIFKYIRHILKIIVSCPTF